MNYPVCTVQRSLMYGSAHSCLIPNMLSDKCAQDSIFTFYSCILTSKSKIKQMTEEKLRFEVADCVCFLSRSSLQCVCVYSRNLSTHWPFSTDVDKQRVQPQHQHSDRLIDWTNAGSNKKSQCSCIRKKVLGKQNVFSVFTLNPFLFFLVSLFSLLLALGKCKRRWEL